MAGVPFWGGDPRDGEDEKNAWDYCWLGDDLLPGIVEDVDVPDGGRDVDAQKAKGDNGVTLKDNGVGAKTVTITLRMWDQEHHEAWKGVRERIDPANPGNIRKPLTITHPKAVEEKIKGVYVKQIVVSHPSPVSGRTATITCVEWFPQPKAAKSEQKIKPAGAGPSGRLGLPGEALPLDGREGLDGLNFGPDPKSPHRDIGVDRERQLAEEAARKRALDAAVDS